MTFNDFLRFILFAAMLGAGLAGAQNTTYRWVDKKTGQTVFSDQPPPPDAKQIVTKSATERESDNQLPYATRQAAEKFPVVVYTMANCADECKQARDFLNARGVPFSEKMLSTQEDIDALSKLLGSEAAVPSITVGRQNFRGFESGAWTNLLDLAGYPKSAPFGTKPSGAFAK